VKQPLRSGAGVLWVVQAVVARPVA
jgi:hypothetical protein